MGRNLVIAIYSHPEYYPPTLNAIDLLAPEFDNVFVLHRNIHGFDWEYPANVKLLGPGKLFPVRAVEKAGYFKKLWWFLSFAARFLKIVRQEKPQTILLYDAISVFAYRLTRLFFKKPEVLWYHNHDVSEAKYIRKYSINWFGWKSEKWIFPYLQLFSLPSRERFEFFPKEKLKGEFVFLPNFPSLNRYSSQPVKVMEPIRLLYQGSIGPMHGLENIIPLLKNQYSGHSVQLILKGFVNEQYLQTLLSIAKDHQVEDKVIYLPPTGYQEVIRNASNCHIGIGIFMKQDIMNNTLGTASNKIYEYAAAGLPVLIYDNPHFRASLQNREWVCFTDVTDANLDNCISRLISDYCGLSKLARHDFEKEFCFENYFSAVFEVVVKRIVGQTI